MSEISGEINYTVRVHSEADGSYWAEVSELPGCFASGESEAELWEALAEAVEIYLSTPDSKIKVRVASKEVVDQSEIVETKLALC